MFLQRNFDFKVWSDKFLRHLKRKNYSGETISGYTKDLEKFSRFVYEKYEGFILVEEINTGDIQDYMDFLKEIEGYKVNSIARHLCTLKSFFKFLVNELNFKDNPAVKIQKPKSHTPLPQVLSIEEVESLLDSAKEVSYYLYVMFNFIYYTGTRVSPARTLLKQHVDLQNEKVYFPYIKGGRDLFLPLHPKLTTILEGFLDSTKHNGSDYVFTSPKNKFQPVGAEYIRYHLKKVAKKANITKKVTPHILRHSVATHLTVLGVKQAYISEFLGHVDLRSTNRYQHLNVGNLMEAVVKLK
ncbi:tyrosine-type recombinase/integrase [Gottfriedia solisilvae]|uniref:tyrosine-type recombinase/integrase n=1 Tax=Gottfriedia solisilvae TaxID=1516104 RepID=UPI000D3763BD